MEKSTIEVEYRSGRSVPMFLLQKFLRPIKSQLLKAGKTVEEESPEIKIPDRARKRCHVAQRRVDGILIYDFTPRAPKPSEHSDKQKRVLYLAGGGWQLPASSQHVFLCADLVEQMPNTTLSLISYPLAPNYPAAKSLPRLEEILLQLYEDAAQADETVALVGDSAGGNIVLALPLYMLSKDTNAPLPKAIMALSPSTDLRRQNPMMPAVGKHDPLLTIPFIKMTAEKWRGQLDAFDPRVSPLAADLQPLADRDVHVHGITGTYDVLCPDATSFRNRLAEAGVKGKWLEWDKQMHVWVLTERYGLREAREGLEWIAHILNEI
ncbi:hypothetical protein AMS68_007292 [Peltaster fructicola]|uniref:Alpha/beta hydrolase fold-3 domain-containing protein n=1 Tax=Peltaster fructicola TaxID=286661 RepID=A0A6H0Y4C1_9PEZI|nr:hypothetical protein AMS68_007292 [Peltaster fructicola]